MENFWPRVAATLIGTISGFVFSLILFYWTESRKRKKSRRLILTSLEREFGFTIRILEEELDKLNKIIELIGSDILDVFYSTQFQKFARNFILKAYNEGILHDCWNDEQLIKMNEIMMRYDVNSDVYYNQEIEKWQSGESSKNEAMQVFTFKRNELTEDLKQLKELRISTTKAVREIS